MPFTLEDLDSNYNGGGLADAPRIRDCHAKGQWAGGMAHLGQHSRGGLHGGMVVEAQMPLSLGHELFTIRNERRRLCKSTMLAKGGGTE